MNILTRRATIVIAASAIILFALHALESQWPPIALWAFVLLSLTLGFGHGALDAVLLLEQFQPRIKALAISVMYLLCVLLTGWAFTWSVPLALLLLILMSVWHFGELHSYALWTRLSVGGASVMWPVLVAQNAMSQLVQGTLGHGFSALWTLWNLLAYCWLFLVLANALYGLTSWIVHRKQPSNIAQSLKSVHQQQMLWAAVEIVTLLCAYLVLSPLLAFAMYFGLYHCLVHIARVRRAVQASSGFVFSRYAVAFAASVLITVVLLMLLWWFLPAKQLLGYAGNAQLQLNQIMQWLVVSLAAVTLPHLLLVSYSARWLGR
jgi:Brp/Blh family beta-carotene 15,15'-monooxygenase